MKRFGKMKWQELLFLKGVQNVKRVRQNEERGNEESVKRFGKIKKGGGAHTLRCPRSDTGCADERPAAPLPLDEA